MKRAAAFKRNIKVNPTHDNIISLQTRRDASLMLKHINKPNHLHMSPSALILHRPETFPDLIETPRTHHPSSLSRETLFFLLCHIQSTYSNVTFKEVRLNSQIQPNQPFFKIFLFILFPPPGRFVPEHKRSPPLRRHQSDLAESLEKTSTPHLPSTQIRA